jgi:hypothetical protein
MAQIRRNELLLFKKHAKNLRNNFYFSLQINRRAELCLSAMTITEEQKARMERNRQEALERRARMQSQEPAAAQMAGERENDKNAEQAGASTGDLQEQTNGTGIEAKHESGQKILTASSKEAPAPPASVVSNLLDELLARRSCAAAGEAVGKYELLDKALQHDGGADDLKEAMVSRLDDIIVSVVTMILSK